LSVPTGVTHAGEPIRVILAQRQSPARRLAVAVYCRGRLIAHEAVTASSGTSEVQLNPTAEPAGVLRVTILEQQQGQWRPLAERLVYRVPAERLVLSAQTDKKKYQAGDRVQMSVRTRTEQGQAAPAWLLVAVVDDQVVGGSGETSLPASFLLTSGLDRPEDLEQADVLLHDAPQSAQALDLFLGTQGWRRFIETEQPLLAAGSGTERARPLIAARDSDPAQADARYQKAVRLAQLKVEQEFATRDRELAVEEKQRSEGVERAEDALQSYAERGRNYARLGLAGTVLVLFGVGCVALGIALVRLLVGRTASLPYFATAFTALLVCLLAYVLVISGQTPEEVGSRADNGANGAGARSIPEGPRQLPVVPVPGRPATRKRTDAGQWIDPLTRTANAVESQGARRGKDLEALLQRVQVLDKQHPGAVEKPDPRLAEAMKRITQQNRAVGASPEKDETPHPLPLVPYVHAYARQFAPTAGDFRQTLLWVPALKVGSDGTATLPPFELSDSGNAYRILIYGHTPSGRLGVFTTTLQSRPRPAQPAH
jgi:hypothetical protein